jgi:hypothetical protein
MINANRDSAVRTPKAEVFDFADRKFHLIDEGIMLLSALDMNRFVRAENRSWLQPFGDL